MAQAPDRRTVVGGRTHTEAPATELAREAIDHREG
jgi:hypothetical protein